MSYENKIKWVKQHFKRHEEEIHYIAYVAETNQWQPMTAEQFSRHTPVGLKWHKFDEPVIREAALQHGDSKDILWASDKDIENTSLKELKEKYNDWVRHTDLVYSN